MTTDVLEIAGPVAQAAPPRRDRAAAAIVLGACVLAGLLAGWRPAVLVYLAIVLFVLGGAWVLLSRETFERACAVMLVTLPLQSALVLDIGITVRQSYVFGGIAIVAGILLGRMRRIPSTLPVWLLGAFLLVVIVSVLQTVNAPVISYAERSGFRGMPGLRPLLQVAQLLLMLGLMWATVSYCHDERRFRRATQFLAAGGLAVLLYGFYGYGALLTKSTYFEINNAMNTDFSEGYKEQGNSAPGGYIPRPRATFPEPANYANFLLLFLPLVAIRFYESSFGRRKMAWGATLALGLFLFVVAVNSRGAIFGAAAGLAALVVLPRGFRSLLYAVRGALFWAAIAAGAILVLSPLLHGMSLAELLQFLGDRMRAAADGTNRVSQDWAIVSRAFRENPLLGVGFGNYAFYAAVYEGMSMPGVVDAGGVYQRLLAETGLMGALLYVGFVSSLLLALVLAFRRRTTAGRFRPYLTWLFFALTADAVQRLSTVGIATDSHLWVAYGLSIALLQLIAVEARRAEAPSA